MILWIFFQSQRNIESRLAYEAAPDFAVSNWDALKQKAQTDERFSYISREKWNAVEFKTQNCLAYFLNPLVSEVYGIE